MSSPVFTITVTSSGATTRTSPRRNFPAPMPPASAATFITGQRSSLGRMPEAAAPQLRRALVRAEAGKALSLDEATALVAARGDALTHLMRLAARSRALGHGSTVTYS